jgi:hypothetical protein
VQDHGRRREYPTLGGVLAPSQADLPPRDIIMMMRGERLESRGFFSKQRGVTRSQPGLITPRHARRTTGVTGVFLDAEHAPKEFCLSLAAVQPTSLSHEASTQLRTRHFLMRLEQLHKSENRTLAKTDRRLEQLHQIAHLSVSLVHEFPLAAGTAPQIGKPDAH